ncbi:NAD(P)-binding protein [Thozetella sp. PMI_491]|nr:NAD(P)-binding protein [Thozetella sp. PMI_491]
MSDRTRNPMKWLALANFATSHHDTYPFIDPTKADLSGKSVFITGASKGIGKAVALSFAKAGCSQIAIAARSSLADVEAAVKAAAKEASRPEPQVLALQTDVASEASVAAAAEAVTAAFGGKLDVLINNAGYLEQWKPIAESDPVEWWRSWEINIKGSYLCARSFLPLLLRSETKTMINLSSAGGHNTTPGASAYQGSRFATMRFNEFVDQEYYEQGVIAIAAHPGGVPTELALNMPAYMHAVLVDTAELPGDTFVWLAKDRRDWLAGRFINAQWDMEELEQKKDEIVERDLLKFRMAV